LGYFTEETCLQRTHDPTRSANRQIQNITSRQDLRVQHSGKYDSEIAPVSWI